MTAQVLVFLVFLHRMVVWKWVVVKDLLDFPTPKMIMAAVWECTTFILTLTFMPSKP